MDAKARHEYDRSLETTVPDFTEDNVRATFMDLFQNANKMFARGIVELFQQLDRRYCTNDPFKIDNKIVTSGWFEANRFGSGLQFRLLSGCYRPYDLDRALQLLDGKEYQHSRLVNAVDAAWRNTPGPWVYRDEYLEVKGYKNGNAHIHFLRPDMVDKMNALIAEHYGANTLPAGR